MENTQTDMEDNDIVAIYERAVGNYQLANYQDAIDGYTKLIEIGPSNAEIYYSRGVAKHQIEDYQGAIFDYTEAIKIDPGNSNIYNNRGIALSLSLIHI